MLLLVIDLWELLFCAFSLFATDPHHIYKVIFLIIRKFLYDFWCILSNIITISFGLCCIYWSFFLYIYYGFYLNLGAIYMELCDLLRSCDRIKHLVCSDTNFFFFWIQPFGWWIQSVKLSFVIIFCSEIGSVSFWDKEIKLLQLQSRIEPRLKCH